MKRKGADREVMEPIETHDVSPLGEDPELLSPAEEALLEAGNASQAQEQTPHEQQPAAAQTAETPVTEPLAERHEPQDSQAEGDEPREDLSDEQVRKLAPNDTVPAWSLMKERQENRSLKRNLENLTRKLNEHEERWNRAGERLRLLQQRTALDAAAAGRNADPEPDPKADPEAHYQWELRQHRRALETLHQQQVSAAQAQAAQHQAALSGLEQQFVLAGHPDYYERVNFLRQRRNHELELMGYADPAERAQIIANETAMLVGGAIRQGRNPAAVAHELSERWGYQTAARQHHLRAPQPRRARARRAQPIESATCNVKRPPPRVCRRSRHAPPKVPSPWKISQTWTTRPTSATSTKTAATWACCSAADDFSVSERAPSVPNQTGLSSIT